MPNVIGELTGWTSNQVERTERAFFLEREDGQGKGSIIYSRALSPREPPLTVHSGVDRSTSGFVAESGADPHKYRSCATKTALVYHFVVVQACTGYSRKDAGLGKLWDLLVYNIFVAQGCQDDDTSAGNDLRSEKSRIVHTRAVTPIRAILNMNEAAVWGLLKAHPLAKTPIDAILNKSQRPHQHFVCVCQYRFDVDQSGAGWR